jgi:preprotein translocase subunit SecE
VSNEKTKVTRISASDDAKVAPKPKLTRVASKSKSDKTLTRSKRSYGPLGRIGGYFKGAWQELRQVHWPTRKSTWGLTLAVLMFSAFFVVFITLLDAGFKFVFEQILR